LIGRDDIEAFEDLRLPAVGLDVTADGEDADSRVNVGGLPGLPEFTDDRGVRDTRWLEMSTLALLTCVPRRSTLLGMLCPRCQRTVDDDWAVCPYDGEPLRSAASPIAVSSPRPAATKMAGAILGTRFQIKGFVNKAATGRVYLAEDVRSHEKVIVKLLAPDDASSDVARARFQREAELMIALDHPNIIKVLAHGEMNGRPYLVTEALRGESLHDYLKREHTMPTDVALAMIRHAAHGLHAAHTAGIIHRDVKPGNLFLLGPIGNPYGLKLIDFGLAKGAASQRISAHDLVLGTIEYMAPELIVSDPTDARTDVYGLGVVMFRVFTGHLPFDAETDFEMLAHQMFSPAPPASWLNEQIDPRIELVMLRAMRKRPENRYPTMEALVADVDRILGLLQDHDIETTPRPTDDTYEPLTALGLEAANLLRERFVTR
jgi:serine/threonine protein kinase